MHLLYTEPSAAASGDDQEASLAAPPNESATDQITVNPQLSTPPSTLATGEQRDPQGQHRHPADQARQAAAAEQVFLYLQVQQLLCQNAHLLQQWSQWQINDLLWSLGKDFAAVVDTWQSVACAQVRISTGAWCIICGAGCRLVNELCYVEAWSTVTWGCAPCTAPQNSFDVFVLLRLQKCVLLLQPACILACVSAAILFIIIAASCSAFLGKPSWRTRLTFTLACHVVQVLTACLKSFAHGANDTANAAGPFAAVQSLYLSNAGCESITTPFWVLAFCGFGIVVVSILMQAPWWFALIICIWHTGNLVLLCMQVLHASFAVRFLHYILAQPTMLSGWTFFAFVRRDVVEGAVLHHASSCCQWNVFWLPGQLCGRACIIYTRKHGKAWIVVQGLSTWGHRVMKTVGKDLVAINFSKGFAIELGSTLSVVLASVVGMPVSSTHCQIGSIVAVGIAEAGVRSIEWSVFSKIVVSWLVTVPLAAGAAAMLLLAFDRLLHV